MKKLLAVILSLICLFSCMSLPVSAAGGVVGEVGTDFFERLFGLDMEEDTVLGYGVFYDIDAFAGVSLIYKPSPTISFNNPGTYTITSDTPLAIDHELICWKDGKGNKYYPGDQIYVDGQITLYAVWAEKQDNDVRVARIIKTCFEALRRLVGKFLGGFNAAVEFKENYKPTNPDDPRYYDLTLGELYYENNNVLIYTGSAVYTDKGFLRDDTINKASVYLCTGWNEITKQPENKTEAECSFGYTTLQAAGGNDVIKMSTGSLISDYEAAHGSEFYLVISIAQGLYYSPASSSKLYPEYTNPISCVFTFTEE